jgi:hypothetical protein
MCTFELFNFDTSTGTSLYQFTAPCVGTGVTGLQMFNPSADRWVHERFGILDSAISPINGNTIISTSENTANIIPSINKYTLDQIRPNIAASQGSKIIPMTTLITQGRLGEFEIRLTKLAYAKCNQEAVYNIDIN